MPTSLPSRVGQILMLLERDFHQRLARDLAARNVQGVSARHRTVFLHLGRHGASRSVDLARAAGIRPQSMMAIVDELQSLGLVERYADPSDSRAKLIDFTTRGRAMIEELSQSTEAVWKQYAEVLGSDELTRVFNGLEALLQHSYAETIA